MKSRFARAALAVLAAAVPLVGSVAYGADGAAPTAPSKQRVLHLPDTPYHYADAQLPSFYNSPPVRRLDNTPSSDPITDAGATLGRVLFYDTRLSANNTVACASCHRQDHAFSDPRKMSVGFAGEQTDRHAMTLVDARYYARGRFFWDERASTLEAQVLLPIQNRKEMGQTLDKVLEMVNADPQYPAMFEKAFGSKTIIAPRLASALAQFVRSLVSYRSRYDQGLASTGAVDIDFPNFTGAENRGKQVFLQRCAQCHLPGGQGVIFTSQQPQNNGLDGSEKVADLGVADVTFNRFQAGNFKTPSLRNIEYTGPYMHDGRFNTLEQVIEHYSSGVKRGPNVDPRVANRPRINPNDKANLIAFLKTLSDPEFMRDPKFSDPFEPKAAITARPAQARPVAYAKPNEGTK